MDTVYRFGRFELQPTRRQLVAEGRPVGLGQRAFDVLHALIQRRERLVTKSELLDIVWPGVVVEENNLQVQISALRKLLGPQAIATIPGRGYRFTAVLDGAAAGSPESAASNPRPDSGAHGPACRTHRRNLPTELPLLYGRDADLVALLRIDRRARPRDRRGGGRHRQEPPRAGGRACAGRPLAGRRVDGRAGRPVRPGAPAERRGAGAPHHAAGTGGRARRAGRGHGAADRAAGARQLRAHARRGRGAGAGGPEQRTERHAAGDQPGTAAPAGRAAVPGTAAGRPDRDDGRPLRASSARSRCSRPACARWIRVSR